MMTTKSMTSRLDRIEPEMPLAKTEAIWICGVTANEDQTLFAVVTAADLISGRKIDIPKANRVWAPRAQEPIIPPQYLNAGGEKA